MRAQQFLSREEDYEPWSFNWICEELDLDPDELRRLIRQNKHIHWNIGDERGKTYE